MTLGLPRPPRGRSAKASSEEADSGAPDQNGAAAQNGTASENGAADQNGSGTASENGAADQNGNGSQNGAAEQNGQNGSGHQSSNGHVELNGAREHNGQFVGLSPDNGAAPEGQGFAVHERFDRTEKPVDQDRLESLEQRVERLSAICEAMWDVVSEEVGLDIDRLTARLADLDPSQALIDEADLQDDTVCPNCGNVKPADEALCLFCSAGSR